MLTMEKPIVNTIFLLLSMRVWDDMAWGGLGFASNRKRDVLQNSQNFKTDNLCMGFLWCLGGQVSTCQWRRHKRHGFNPWGGKSHWSRKLQFTPVFLPGKSHGQRSLAGYSPWGHKELDMIEQLTLLCFI